VANELAKYLNSRRRLKDENAVRKQAKIAKQHKVDGYDSKVTKQPHRFHKHHAMDCGNPECYLCGNPRKTHKDKLTQQEKRLFQDLEKTKNKHSNGLDQNDQEDNLL
jgi:hypothetical protein